jgi:hypothetical protein
MVDAKRFDSDQWRSESCFSEAIASGFLGGGGGGTWPVDKWLMYMYAKKLWIYVVYFVIQVIDVWRVVKEAESALFLRTKE